MGPEDLDAILSTLPHVTSRDRRILVGNETHDDAGVFQLTEDTALVQTVDFFTPVVDDPYLFGRIAAANSLSDIYAMGGKPLTAMNLLATPAGQLEPRVVAQMLTGGQDVMKEAGTVVIGGHSIDDPEPKMGYAVTGLVHPQHIWRNSTAEAGEMVFLTKPIGSGVVIKAIKDGRASVALVEAVTDMMATLNAGAAEAIRQVGDPGACTDVTGFGLLGHLWEMASGAGVRMELWPDVVPLLPGALALADENRLPKGSVRNFNYVLPHSQGLDRDLGLHRLLADAVTSGGLLFTVSRAQSEAMQESFRARGLSLWAIGEVRAGPPGLHVRSRPVA